MLGSRQVHRHPYNGTSWKYSRDRGKNGNKKLTLVFFFLFFLTYVNCWPAASRLVKISYCSNLTDGRWMGPSMRRGLSNHSSSILTRWERLWVSVRIQLVLKPWIGGTSPIGSWPCRRRRTTQTEMGPGASSRCKWKCRSPEIRRKLSTIESKRLFLVGFSGVQSQPGHNDVYLLNDSNIWW